MSDYPAPRRQLHGYVSDGARDGWYEYAAANGTNVTALLEAFGILLGKQVDLEQQSAVLKQVTEQARRIASTRSTRRRADQPGAM